MTKAIYVNPKTLKMYTSNENELAAVYGPITFKADKKGRIFFLADVEKQTSANGIDYFRMTAVEPKKETKGA